MLRFYPALIIFLIVYQADAQQLLTLSDPETRQNSGRISDLQTDYINTLYYQKVDVTAQLINGREFNPYYLKAKTRPILVEGKKHSGSLIFKNRRYNNLKLDYDTYTDQIIYSDSSKFLNNKLFRIVLNKDPVDGFCLCFPDDSMIFRHFRSGDGTNFNLPEGFYEVVYDGQSKYIIKHQSIPDINEGLNVYTYSMSQYIFAGKRFYDVKSSKSFVRLFGKDSDAIRAFMKKNRLRFNKADKYDIASVLRYYDSLEMSQK
jgi:hypothetical protein